MKPELERTPMPDERKDGKMKYVLASLAAVFVAIAVTFIAYMGGYNFQRGTDGFGWSLFLVFFPTIAFVAVVAIKSVTGDDDNA